MSITWTNIDICYNTNFNGTALKDVILSGTIGTDSNGNVIYFYDNSDLNTNILVSKTDTIITSLTPVYSQNYNVFNNNSIVSPIIISKFPKLNNILKSIKYFILQNNKITFIDTILTSSSSNLNWYKQYNLSNHSTVNNIFYGILNNGSSTQLGSTGVNTYYSSISAKPLTNSSAISIDYSLLNSVNYFKFTIKVLNELIYDAYYVIYSYNGTSSSQILACYTTANVGNSYLYSDFDINNFNVYSHNSKGFGNGAGLVLSSIPTLDPQYNLIDGYLFKSGPNLSDLTLSVGQFIGGDQVSLTSYKGINITKTQPSVDISFVLTDRPVSGIPPIQYARMRINYDSVVSGNAVGGVVFDGYYSYQTTDNKVVSLYSSSDLTTNLLIPSTDPFVTGALTILGKSSSNTAGSTGIDTTASHAGIFVKDLPFVNALFKSNPYVVLKPSGMVMFDNYGEVNANVLATSYFANKYVMSNGNVYSNKNNSFFSFSNFTFTYNAVSAIPTVNAPLAIDYTFFNSIKQIAYTAKYNGAVVKDSYFVFYLDRFNNYHMCAQYVKTANYNILVSSDASCDNFPNTGNFGNTAVDDENQSTSTLTATSGDAASATVTTSEVNETGTPTVIETINVVGETRTVNLNALNSNICFSEGSIVSTDQGDVEIQNIDIHYHTIRNNKIIALTETQSIDNYLVKIKKNAFGSVPTQDTEMTGNHMIFNNGFIQAKTLINGNTIEKIPYRGLPLYNILLEQHDIMNVNGLITETLNPENPIAKYYVMMEKNPENKFEMENIWRKRTQEIIHASF